MDEKLDKVLGEAAKALRRKRDGQIDQPALDKAVQDLVITHGLTPREAAERIDQRLRPAVAVRRVLALTVLVLALIAAMLLALFATRTARLAQQEADRIRGDLDAHFVSHQPSRIDLVVVTPTVASGTQGQVSVRASVWDGFGHLVGDGTPVTLTLGSLPHPQQSKTQATLNGAVETSFVLNPAMEAGEIQIFAQAGQNVTNTTSVQIQRLTEPSLSLTFRLDSELASVSAGGKIKVVYTLKNNGPGTITNGRISTKIPTGTVFEDASPQVVQERDLVIWKQDSLAAGAPPVSFSLWLRVKPTLTAGTQIVLTSNDCEVHYNTGFSTNVSLRGQGNVTLQVTGPSGPTALSLSAVPNSLPADGKSSATLSIEVSGATGLLSGATQIVLSVSPEGAGRVDRKVTAIDGRVTTNFIAGTMPGTVTVTASAGQISQTLPIPLSALAPTHQAKTGKTKEIANLYSEPRDVWGALVIIQLPPDVSVELLEDTDGTFQRAAVSVWLPKGVLVIENDQSIATISKDAQNQKVRVGAQPNDLLNNYPDSARQLSVASQDRRVGILDSITDKDYIRVRVEGWILSRSLVEDK